MNENEIKLATVLDILDKLHFFQGSRAGRELWTVKKPDVQETDIANFNRDINIVREYIKYREQSLNDIIKELEELHKAPLVETPYNNGWQTCAKIALEKVKGKKQLKWME